MKKLFIMLVSFLVSLGERGAASYILPRKVTGYSDISEDVLAEQSIIRQVSNLDIEGTPGFTTVSVLVHSLTTVGTYVPGTGLAPDDDTSAYVNLANGVEIGVNEVLDGFTVVTAPMDLAVKRLSAAVSAIGESIDTASLVIMEAGGTDLVVATAVAAGSFIVGTWYIVKTANAAGDASALAGTAASTALVDEVFLCTGNGTGLTSMAVQASAPLAASVYTDILAMSKALNDVKAPRRDRSLIISTRVEQELLAVESKIILNTDKGDRVIQEGWIGRVSGFDIYVTTLIPSGTNMIAMQKRGFAFGYNWKVDPAIKPLFNSFIGDSAVQGRLAYNCGAVRATLIQLNQGVYTTV